MKEVYHLSTGIGDRPTLKTGSKILPIGRRAEDNWPTSVVATLNSQGDDGGWNWVPVNPKWGSYCWVYRASDLECSTNEWGDIHP